MYSAFNMSERGTGKGSPFRCSKCLHRHFLTLLEAVQHVVSEKDGRGKHAYVQCCVHDCSSRVRQCKFRLHIRKSHRDLCPVSCSACPAKFVEEKDSKNHQRNGCPSRNHLSYPVTTPGSFKMSKIGKHKATCLIIITRENFPKEAGDPLQSCQKTLCDPSNLGNNVLVCSGR